MLSTFYFAPFFTPLVSLHGHGRTCQNAGCKIVFQQNIQIDLSSPLQTLKWEVKTIQNVKNYNIVRFEQSPCCICFTSEQTCPETASAVGLATRPFEAKFSRCSTFLFFSVHVFFMIVVFSQKRRQDPLRMTPIFQLRTHDFTVPEILKVHKKSRRQKNPWVSAWLIHLFYANLHLLLMAINRKFQNVLSSWETEFFLQRNTKLGRNILFVM